MAAGGWASTLYFIRPIQRVSCLPCCRMTAEGDKACRLVVEYTLVYVTSVNALLKRAIERGGWGLYSAQLRDMPSAPHLSAALSLCASVAAWSCRSAAALPGAVQHPLALPCSALPAS